MHEKRPDIYPNPKEDILSMIAAGRSILNSRYGIDPKPLDCCGWIGVWPSTFEEAVPKVIRDKMKDGDWVCPWSGTINDILPKRRVNKPQVFYISSACYSDNTKQMLDELKERIDKSSWAASQWEIIDDPWTSTIGDWIREQQKIADQHVMDALLYSVPKYTISTNEPRLKDLYYSFIQPYETNAICKLQTEETKMEAKKCERCGKLYEMADARDCITAYMPGIPVPDWKKESFTDSRIRKENTRVISVMNAGDVVDLCPECREKLKNFFESGKDEESVAVGLYGETVIKKPEE